MHLKYRTVIFVWACLLLCGRLWAQEQLHYVYIQSEKGQPFYVKHNGKVLSSTERGYIIIPRLETGTAPITVGFPNKESKEARFNLRITKSDQGFLLKQSGEAGYSLYNLQTFRELRSDAGETALAAAPPAADSIVPELDTAKKEMMTNLQKDLETTFADKAIVTGPAKSAPAAPAKSGNPFASALDKVVVGGDDRNEPEPAPEVKKEAAPAEAAPVAIEEEVKKPRKKRNKGEREPLTEEEQAILSGVLAEEGKTAASEAAAQEAEKAAAPAEEPVKKRSKKHKAKEGDPDFIEFQDDKAPTAVAATTEAAAPVVVEVPVTEEAPVRAKKKRKKVFDDTEHPANIITDSSGYGIAVTEEEPVKSKKKKKRSEEEVVNADAAGAPVGAEVVPEMTPAEKKKADARLINSDCTNVMDDDTFRKVLRKFVAARTDNSMIDVFKKQTRNYCLETVQVKTLVQLLTADDTRYRLLDAAYSKTVDTEKYGSLETLLIDDYYRGRFKAMLHK